MFAVLSDANKRFLYDVGVYDCNDHEDEAVSYRFPPYIWGLKVFWHFTGLEFKKLPIDNWDLSQILWILTNSVFWDTFCPSSLYLGFWFCSRLHEVGVWSTTTYSIQIFMMICDKIIDDFSLTYKVIDSRLIELKAIVWCKSMAICSGHLHNSFFEWARKVLNRKGRKEWSIGLSIKMLVQEMNVFVA